MPNGEWTAFIKPFSKQWPLKTLYNYCQTFTHSHTHSHTYGGVSHARRPVSQCHLVPNKILKRVFYISKQLNLYTKGKHMVFPQPVAMAQPKNNIPQPAVEYRTLDERGAKLMIEEQTNRAEFRVARLR